MKLLLENWREYLTEQSPSVKVKFPDIIPPELLAMAEEDPELTGYVYPEEPEKDRAGIYHDDELVGFMTPRQNRHSLWRVGAIYIQPEHRRLGIAPEAIKNFLSDRPAAQTPIAINNTASQKAFIKAGFRLLNPDEVLVDDGWKYQMWGRK
jgi:RimJ/RimL family protein N-acetyltransferase